MGNFKGTKGEWECSYQLVMSNGFYIQTIDKSHKNTFIGEVGGGFQIPEEIKANALLISKAPEMLDMLRECLFYFETLNPKSRHSNQLRNLIKEATEL